MRRLSARAYVSGLLPGLIMAILLAFIGIWLGEFTGLPLPGGVFGFFILLSALWLVPELHAQIERGAELLLDNLILLFIPAVMSIIAYPEFFGILGLKLLLVLVFGTVLMMVSTGLFAQWLLRRTGRERIDRQS